MNSSIDTNEIKLEISEELENNKNRIVPFILTNLKPSKTIKEILDERVKDYEREFHNFFKLVTNSVEFKMKMFYNKVKMVIEANRILLFECYIKDPKNNKDNKEKDEKINPISRSNNNDYENPLIVLDFDQVTAGVSVKSKSKKFKIYVLGSNRDFKFKTTFSSFYFSLETIHIDAFIQANSLNNIFYVRQLY